jgi:protein-tyrosine-phosphatase
MQMMSERGVDLAGHASEGLERLDPSVRWDCLVTMGCGDACPSVAAVCREDWDLPDPKEMSDADFRRVRDRIEEKVSDLLRRCAETRAPA